METMERSSEVTCFSINLFTVNEDQVQGEIQVAKQRQHQGLSLQLSTGLEETELTIQDGKYTYKKQEQANISNDCFFICIHHTSSFHMSTSKNK